MKGKFQPRQWIGLALILAVPLVAVVDIADGGFNMYGGLNSRAAMLAGYDPKIAPFGMELVFLLIGALLMSGGRKDTPPSE